MYSNLNPTMNKTSHLLRSSLLLTLAAGVVLFVAPAAQAAAGPKAKLLAKYDLNNDGKLDADEMAAIRKDFAANPEGELKRFDKNHDGKLSDEEIAAMIPGSTKKGGKKSGEKKSDSAKPDETKADTAKSDETKPDAAKPAADAAKDSGK